jgi:hypothetical protein
VSVTPSFAGLSGAGLCQLNLTVPPGLGAGDVSLQASVGGVPTPAAVVISLQKSGLGGVSKEGFASFPGRAAVTRYAPGKGSSVRL